MTDPLEAVLQHLSGIVKAGKNLKALCPAHGDKTPSLSVATGDDGRVLLHCFSGCSVESVVNAVGLAMTDLFPQGATHCKVPSVSGVSLRELRQAADFERQILFIVKADQMHGRAVSQIDLERARLAMQRVLLAKQVL
jgi:putative DNA primase/helicase